MAGYLPPGCTQRECDEAQPGYWDEPNEPDPIEAENYALKKEIERLKLLLKLIASSAMEATKEDQ